ncbi:MAG TPA: SDR family NAD(P)-dependent oxidoreductase [Sphingopyxis sp.]|uniref:SDR family NAD(P)-dependent oxidoreductase n=1 Tax=Sphingopyxis sp. TaxID=1908224 RepID=UPI002E31DF59|nr:SDR family NAD(P)-dependent oxidoreductase [Sphingopyxis sp.]HEX2813832.1 SDR family NAD(P)-dependent oxidoreductase [Sphingopyxis sp.]
MDDNRTFEGKTLLITGANRGLGAALVEAAFARGAAKIYCGVRDIANFGPALDRFGGRAVAVALDVTNDAHVAAASDVVDVDIVVSNAGVTHMVPLLETTLEGARATMETNFFGPLRLVYAFGPDLDARGGGFISVLSLAALVPAHGAELYSASKAAGTMLGHAVRGAMPNVAVTLAYPGLMDTDMMRSSDFAKTSPQEIAANILDGWAGGETAVFPDLHSQYLRDAFVGRPQEVLTDPYALMRDALLRYLEARG